MGRKTNANDIYKAACRLIFETPDDDEDLKSSFPDILETMMFEALPYENAMRAAHGVGQLAADDIPRIEKADDVETMLPFDERFLRLGFKYGVVSRFLGDDNSKKAESLIEWNKFVDTLGRDAPATFESVVSDGF